MVEINFDKRLDLVFGLLYYASIDKNLNIPYVTDANSEYSRLFYRIYQKGITDEFLDYITNGGLGTFSECIDIALSLDDEYNVVKNSRIDDITNRNKLFNPEELSNFLKEFTQKCEYNQFYNFKTNVLEKLKAKYAKSLNTCGEFNPEIIENFFGYKIGDIKIILSNFIQGSYSLELEDKTVIITGLKSYINHKFEKYTISTLFREISHLYVNPLGEKYFRETDINNVLILSQRNGLNVNYNDCISLVNAYVTKSIQIILCSKYFDKDIISRMIERRKKIGYIEIENLIMLFKKKNQYASFEEFYQNEIVVFFQNFNKKLGDKWASYRKVYR